MKLSKTLVTLMALAGIAGIAHAQNASAPATPPATVRYLVNQYQLKPDMVDEFLDLQKNEVIPALKKGGIEHRLVLRSVLGAREEVIVARPLPTFAEGDAPGPQEKALGREASLRLNAKLRKCIVSENEYVTEVVTRLSVPAPTDAKNQIWVTSRGRIKPGKMQENEKYFETDLVPLVKKIVANGNVLGFLYLHGGIGTGPNEVSTTWILGKYADLDKNPGGGVISAEQGAKISTRLAELGDPLGATVSRVDTNLTF